jgi:hypothetical protein
MPSFLSRLNPFRLFSSSASAELSRLHRPLRIFLGAALAFLTVLILYFIVEKIFIYYFARGYVEAIADAWDVNKNLANGLFWIVFASTILFAAYALSFQERNE